ncbi:MAG: hypothetical protein HWE11_15465 [Gammaproteobacteria bacterium]|nr:hypothetical protein [Gammaproteobacteria bacterium]
MKALMIILLALGLIVGSGMLILIDCQAQSIRSLADYEIIQTECRDQSTVALHNKSTNIEHVIAISPEPLPKTAINFSLKDNHLVIYYPAELTDKLVANEEFSIGEIKVSQQLLSH